MAVGLPGLHYKTSPIDTQNKNNQVFQWAGGSASTCGPKKENPRQQHKSSPIPHNTDHRLEVDLYCGDEADLGCGSGSVMDLCLAIALGPEPCLCGGMNHYNNCDNRGGAMGMEQGWWNKLTVNFGLERSFRRSGQDSLLKAVFQCFNTPSEQVKATMASEKLPTK